MSAEEPVKVMYRPRCPFAAVLRARLRLTRIPYRSVRFRDDEALAAQVRRHNDGNEISPTVLVAAVWLTNPSIGAVRQARSARP